jgi:molecular chaperone DnaK
MAIRNPTGPIIGIDLGTTNSCVAVMKDNEVVVIENEGKRTTPSIFAVDKSGNRLVGYTAQRQMIINPKNTFFSTKRLIGRRFTDPEVQQLKKQVSFNVVTGPNGDAWVSDDKNKLFSPEQVASSILIKLKEAASSFLKCEVNRAVITVPAYFDQHQRQATEAAGKIAGLHVERIINEPTAAALAYGISRDEDKLIAVYDLGGGTFDISILSLGDGVFEVKSTAGDTFLGGEDFNSALMNYILRDYKKKENIDLSNDKVALQRIREAAENAKHDLSTRDSVQISLPYIAVDNGKPKNLEMTITRSQFESLVDDLIKKSIIPCKKALNDAGLKVEDITDVILVGGMTRMPKVRETVKNFFKKEPFAGVNPDEAVAVGAALQGSIISNKGLIPGTNADREIVLLDVTPLNLGIELHGGEMAVIIPAQAPIPCTKTHTFTTVFDNQTSVKTDVYQGNFNVAVQNRLLGSYTVTGIPPAPKGVPKIDVTFAINANGTIHATSKDRASGKVFGITIQMTGGLSADDIEKMRKEAESSNLIPKKSPTNH